MRSFPTKPQPLGTGSMDAGSWNDHVQVPILWSQPAHFKGEVYQPLQEVHWKSIAKMIWIG
jgi:hypothetical protein